MTIDKAIEILTDELNTEETFTEPDFQDALKLGLEALKFTKTLRDTAYITKIHLLPGETKD